MDTTKLVSFAYGVKFARGNAQNVECSSVREFLRGVFETIGYTHGVPNVVGFTLPNSQAISHMRSELKRANLAHDEDGADFTFENTNKTDFMAYLYPHRYANGMTIDLNCNVHLDDPSAIMPSKVRASDVGYDLTLIRESKRVFPTVIMYDTGVRIEPGDGFYVELVPRSSLIKTGWMMANSVGIIDASYRGTLKVVLVRVVPDAPDISLPFTGFQLIFRKQINATMTTVSQLDQTARGEGGFGSTSNKQG